MSDIKLYVASTRFGKTYRINKFIEYRIDINMENDADSFEFVVSNVDGELNGIFSDFDFVEIILNGKKLMKGIIDTVAYDDANGDTISVNGRDLREILVDNDAIPNTHENVDPVSYTKKRCDAFGIKYSSYIKTGSIPQLIIGTGESEIAVFNNLFVMQGQRLWYHYDTLYSGTWNTNAKSSCTLVRGNINSDGIRIESLSYTEDSKNTKTEIIVYGSVNGGSEKVVGTAKNPGLYNRGIVRRMTKTSSNNDSASKYSASALKDVRDSLRNNITLNVRVYTNNHFILPNNTTHVIDERTGIDANFYIYGVLYTKSIDDGSVIALTMMPQDDTFEIIWKAQAKGNTITNKKDKIKNYIDTRRRD